MANTFDLISLKISSLKNYQDESLANNVLNKINEYGKNFIPQVYGIYQPIKNKYSSSNISDVIQLWMNKENNKKNVENFYAAGQLLMEKKSGHKVSYQMRWEKDNQARFNYFILSVDIGYLSKEEAFHNFVKLCYELVLLLEPVHGEIVNLSYPGWEAPINLRVRHPELNWLVLFGEPYIDLFGRDKLLNTPCYKVEPIGDKVITLQLTDNVFEPIPSSVREPIKKYLGEDAFVEEGKSSRSYKSGMVPEFDFSAVLFDRTKPIEEPQIRVRHKE